MQHIFQPGQHYRITNPDYHIIWEDWEVIAVAYPIITFTCIKRNAVDIAYVQYSWEQTVIGEVIKDDGREVVFAFKQYEGMEVGLTIVGDKATYLLALDPLRNA
jgi:hypothetical protein